MLRTGAGGEVVQLLRKFFDRWTQPTVLRDGVAGAPDVEGCEVPLKQPNELRGEGVVQPDMHDGEYGLKKVWGNKDAACLSHEDPIEAFGDNEAFVEITSFEEAVETSFVSCLGVGNLALSFAGNEPGAQLTLRLQGDPSCPAAQWNGT